MQENTCCFTGHRKLPVSKISEIVKRLNEEIELLIQQDVDTFISGGALGFDQMAATLIAAKKDMGYNVRLVMALPCRGQEQRWPEKEQETYRYLLAQADEVEYLSEAYSVGCMKKRNQYMVDRSKYCICALLNEKSGTGQTVRYARRKQRHVINIAR